MTHTPDFPSTDSSLEAHLRRTLHSVAAAIEGAPPAASPRRRRRRGFRVAAVAALGGATAWGLAAWNGHDEGEIVRVPVEAALQHGSLEGYDWWLVPSAAIGHRDVCGDLFDGVELVSADMNKPGLEWNTGGVDYGEPPVGETCGNDEAAWLGDASRFNGGFFRLGESDDPRSPWGGFFAVHPSIRTIRVDSDASRAVVVDTVAMPGRDDGPRYAGFAVPSEACQITVTLEPEGPGGVEPIEIERTLCEG